MRTLLLVMTSILVATLGSAHTALAAIEVDIPAVTGSVSNMEPEALVAALHDPMPNEALPPAFSDATYVDPRDTANAPAATATADVDGLAGSISYALTYTPGGSATPSTQASPQANGPERIYNRATLQYLIFNHELDAASLGHFDETFRTAVGDQAADADVEEVTVENATAYRISIETETNGVPILIEWLAVPVGSVAVIGMTMTGGEAVKINAVHAESEALTLAGVAHLGAATENPSTPAG